MFRVMVLPWQPGHRLHLFYFLFHFVQILATLLRESFHCMQTNKHFLFEGNKRS